MSKIFKLDEINLNDITLSDLDKDIIYLHYKENFPILIETPSLFCVDKIEINKNKYTTHELIVTLNGKNEHETFKTKTFFKKLDEKLIEIGKSNFKKMDIKVENLMYKSIIRNIDEENDYYKNGVIKMKFVKTKTFSTLLFDNDKNIVSPEKYNLVLKGNNYVKMILELVCIWFKDNVYGIYMRLHQMKIVNGNIPSLMTNSYLFGEDTNSDEEEIYFNDTEKHSAEKHSINLTEIKQNIESEVEIDGYQYILTDSSDDLNNY